jgi:hypothetical protein
VFKKLFGKKNDGFYLQLEDEDATPKPAAKAKSAPPASKAPDPVVAPPAVPVATIQAAPVASTPVAQAAPIEQEAKKSGKKSGKQAKTDKKAEEPKASVVAPVAPPVAVEPAIKNFATDYLIKPSSTSSRRRPGANMNGFLDMARQAKKQEPFKK